MRDARRGGFISRPRCPLQLPLRHTHQRRPSFVSRTPSHTLLCLPLPFLPLSLFHRHHPDLLRPPPRRRLRWREVSSCALPVFVSRFTLSLFLSCASPRCPCGAALFYFRRLFGVLAAGVVAPSRVRMMCPRQRPSSLLPGVLRSVAGRLTLSHPFLLLCVQTEARDPCIATHAISRFSSPPSLCARSPQSCSYH